MPIKLCHNTSAKQRKNRELKGHMGMVRIEHPSSSAASRRNQLQEGNALEKGNVTACFLKVQKALSHSHPSAQSLNNDLLESS